MRWWSAPTAAATVRPRCGSRRTTRGRWRTFCMPLPERRDTGLTRAKRRFGALRALVRGGRGVTSLRRLRRLHEHAGRLPLPRDERLRDRPRSGQLWPSLGGRPRGAASPERDRAARPPTNANLRAAAELARHRRRADPLRVAELGARPGSTRPPALVRRAAGAVRGARRGRRPLPHQVRIDLSERVHATRSGPALARRPRPHVASKTAPPRRTLH